MRHVQDIAPGDVIAWVRPADSKSRNTGHTLVARGAPRKLADGGFEVDIIDSSGLPHDRADSRRASGATGIGTGVIVLVPDAAGAPVGFRWNPGGRIRTTAVSIGRLSPR